MKPTWQPEPLDDIEQGLLDVADIALAEAAEQGASSSEAAVGQGQGLSVTVRNGEVETVEHNRDKNLGITVYFGHRSGSASTTDFSPEAVRQSVRSACNIARFTEEDEFNGLADTDRLATEFPDLDLHHPWDGSTDEAIDIATRCERAALEHDSRISNTEGATLSSHHGSDLYASSVGFRGFSRGSRHSTSCAVIAGEGGDMQRDYWYDADRRIDELDAPEEIGVVAARRTLRRLNARKLATGEYPVLFEPSVAASLMSHLVSAISGSALYRKASFLVDRAGERVFQPGVRIHEQPLLAGAPGSASFDSEGVATCARDIVTDGVLQGYVLNSYAARKLGLASTGNAGGVRNLELEPSTADGLESLIRQMDRGVVVSELIGFGVNTVTGDYSRGAFGFWVEGGEIQFPVQEFTIAGNLAEIFMSIEATGADPDTRRNVRAGSILVGKMTVAGE